VPLSFLVFLVLGEGTCERLEEGSREYIHGRGHGRKRIGRESQNSDEDRRQRELKEDS
jgi:hypothetical protein